MTLRECDHGEVRKGLLCRSPRRTPTRLGVGAIEAGFTKRDLEQKPERQVGTRQVSAAGSVWKTSRQEQGLGEGPETSDRSGGHKAGGVQGEVREGRGGSAVCGNEVAWSQRAGLREAGQRQEIP